MSPTHGMVQTLGGDRPFRLADGLNELAWAVVFVHETMTGASLVWIDAADENVFVPIIVVEHTVSGVKVSCERIDDHGLASAWDFNVAAADIEAWRGT